MVTGASTGLGEHLARTLAAAGATVAITARRRERLDELARRIEATGGTALPVVMDVADPASIEAGVARTVAVHGGSTCCSTTPASPSPSGQSTVR